MEKEIRKYDLHDPQQYKDEKNYWESKTPEEHLHTLEVIRKSGFKLSVNKQNGDQPRFRRILRLLERK